MEYKAIGVRDAGEMAELFAGAFNAPPWNDSWTNETAAKRLEYMLDGKAAYGLAAYRDGRLCAMAVGCFEIYCGKTVFNLREFCVDRSVKGKGVGTEFYAGLEERLKRLGADEITLNTLRGPQTEEFYKKQGMRSEDEMTVMIKSLKSR